MATMKGNFDPGYQTQPSPVDGPMTAQPGASTMNNPTMPKMADVISARTDPIYIGQTAAKADRSHGGYTDGIMHSRGGPHHPNAGAYEELRRPGQATARLGGVENLKAQSLECIDPDGDGDDDSMSQPMRDASLLGPGGFTGADVVQDNDFYEIAR